MLLRNSLGIPPNWLYSGLNVLTNLLILAVLLDKLVSSSFSALPRFLCALPPAAVLSSVHELRSMGTLSLSTQVLRSSSNLAVIVSVPLVKVADLLTLSLAAAWASRVFFSTALASLVFSNPLVCSVPSKSYSCFIASEAAMVCDKPLRSSSIFLTSLRPVD